MDNKYITPVLVVALIGAVGAATFFAGVKFRTLDRNFAIEAVEPRFLGPERHTQMMMQGMMAEHHGTAGEVTAKDGNTITIKRTNGLTEKIIITGDTDVTRTSQATINDLNIGDRVMVFGQEENGQTSADAIEINPLTRKWIFE